MLYSLTIPEKGLTDFQLYRAPGDLDVEVIIKGNTYLFENLEELKLWFVRVGVPRSFTERLLDIFWNWRVVCYDLQTHRLTIPKDQGHPVNGSITGDQDYVGVLNKGSGDPFDPLQDNPTQET